MARSHWGCVIDDQDRWKIIESNQDQNYINITKHWMHPVKEEFREATTKAFSYLFFSFSRAKTITTTTEVFSKNSRFHTPCYRISISSVRCSNVQEESSERQSVETKRWGKLRVGRKLGTPWIANVPDRSFAVMKLLLQIGRPILTNRSIPAWTIYV